MKARKWNLDTDYDILKQWWEEWEFGVVPLELLPPDGVIVESDKPICAVGVYFGEGCKFCMMDWLVKDKHASLRDSHKSIQLCIDELIKLVKDKGYKLIFTNTSDNSLMKRFTRMHGFKLTENSVRTFVKDVNNSYTDFEFVQDLEQWEKDQK